jgi:hypothetical protein
MNQLNTRERTLLLIVLCFIPVGALYYGWTTYRGMRTSRLDQILRAEQDKVRLKNLALSALQEADRFEDAYNQASLPVSVATNTALYQNFLSDLITRHNLEVVMGSQKFELNVGIEALDAANRPVKEPVFDRLTISDTTVKGSLAQLTDFLYDFYDLAMLHRIESLSVELAAPDKEDEARLSAKFTVSAIILTSAPETKQWSEYATGRLGKSRAEFANSIVARDLFGPPNVAPKITSTANLGLETGETLSHVIRVSDGNPDDRITFELLSSDLEGVQLVADKGNSATLRGSRLNQAGKYRLQVRASDNRLPLLTDEQWLTVTVTDPEPPRPPRQEKPVPPRKQAPDTYITSLLQDREGIAWLVLNNRGTDEITRLQEGESFKMDDSNWTVVKVDRRTVTLRVDDELLEFRVGSSLSEPLSRSKAVTRIETLHKN